MFLLHPSTFTLIPTSHHLSRPRMILETSPASWTSLEGLSSLLPTSEFSYWSLVSPFSSNLKLCVFSPPLLKPSVLSVRGQFFNASFLSSAAPTSFALILRLCPSPHHTSHTQTTYQHLSKSHTLLSSLLASFTFLISRAPILPSSHLAQEVLHSEDTMTGNNFTYAFYQHCLS